MIRLDPMEMSELQAAAERIAHGDNGSSPARPFKYRTLAEIAASPIPAPPVLMESWFLQADMAIATGPYDSLKSRLGAEIAVSIASGNSLLGRFAVPKRGPVILIQNEIHPGVYDKRLLAYTDLHADWLDNLFVISRAGFRIQPDDMLRLEMIMKKEAVKAVVIDPLSESYPLDPNFDENKSTCVTEMLELLKATRDRRKSLVLYVHHNPKDELRRARGSGRLMDAPDVRIEMHGVDAKAGEVARSRVKIRSRNIIAPPAFDVVCGNDGRLRYGAPMRPAQDEVLDAIRRMGSATPKEIAKATDKTDSAVNNLLQELAKHQRVFRDPRKGQGGGFEYRVT